MIKRIVKLTFQEDETENFIQIFNQSKAKIRAREGCRYLELLRDKRNPNIFFTYSFWDSEDYLDQYRHSELFKTTWAKTKALFASKPEAWSTESLVISE